jgi:predicted RNA binding protein YcfA (HicA-like mRNA interferase family)
MGNETGVDGSIDSCDFAAIFVILRQWNANMNIEELIEQLRRTRSPVSLSVFTRIANHFGYELDHVRGSHHVFRNWTGRKYVVPVHKNAIKAVYVRNFIKEQG